MQKTQHKLTVTLTSDLEIVLKRSFDAPKALVYEAFTRCEHLKRWWGCRDTELTICEMDLRVGGAWRRVVRAPDGSEHPFKGEFKEIVPNDKISETLIYDVDFARDFPALETILFDELDGTTTVTTTVRHQTKEARDGHYNSGMEQGAAETFDRLEELLLVLKASRRQG